MAIEARLTPRFDPTMPIVSEGILKRSEIDVRQGQKVHRSKHPAHEHRDAGRREVGPVRVFDPPDLSP